MRRIKQTAALVAIAVLCLNITSTPAKVQAATPGSVDTWTTSSNALPQSRSYSSSVTYNGYVYVLGGSGPGSGNTVYHAQLNANGSTSSWTTSNNPLPVALTDAGAAVHNGYIYIVGGYDTNGRSDLVYYAKLASNGSVGAWTISPNRISDTLMDIGVSTHNGYLYVAGGNNGSVVVDTVQYAPLNSDGTVGTWTTSGNALPLARNDPTSVIHNGFWYVIGGIRAGNYVGDVTYAPLNSDGSVGTWTTSNSTLPIGLSELSAGVYNGYVFTFGGWDGSVHDAVYLAPFNNDGTLGNWTASSSPLPKALNAAPVSIHNGFAYVLGGNDNITNLSDVYYAKLTGYPEPALSARTVNVASGSSTTIDVLSGVAGNPDPSTLAIISGASHGTSSVVAAKLVYSPTASYVGADSLTYRVCSAVAVTVCSQAIISFNVAIPGSGTANVTMPGAPRTGFGSPVQQNWTPRLTILGALASISAGTILLFSSRAAKRY